MENFEEQLRNDLQQFLLSMKEVDERMPECPDVEDKWEEIAKAYIPDGIREFQDGSNPVRRRPSTATSPACTNSTCLEPPCS